MVVGREMGECQPVAVAACQVKGAGDRDDSTELWGQVIDGQVRVQWCGEVVVHCCQCGDISGVQGNVSGGGCPVSQEGALCAVGGACAASPDELGNEDCDSPNECDQGENPSVKSHCQDCSGHCG